MSDDPNPTLQDVESGSWMTADGHLIVPIESDTEQQEDVRPSTSYSNRQCIEFNPTTMEEEADSSDSVDDDEDWRLPSQKKPPKSPISEFEPTTMEEEADRSDSIDDEFNPTTMEEEADSSDSVDDEFEPTTMEEEADRSDSIDDGHRRGRPPRTKFPHANKLEGDGQTEKSLMLRSYEQHLKDQVDKGIVLNRTHMADQIALQYRASNAETEIEANYYKAIQSICNGEDLHKVDKKSLALVIYAEYVKREVRDALIKEGKLDKAISFISSLKLPREPQVIKKRKMECADHDEYLKNPETNAFGLTDDFFDGLPTREDIERHCSDIWNKCKSSEDVNQAGGSLSVNRTVSTNGKRTEKESAKKVKSLTSEEASEYTDSECCRHETNSNKIGSVFQAEGPLVVKKRHLLKLSAEDAARVLNTSSISNVQRNTLYYISPWSLMSNESEANPTNGEYKVVYPNTKVGKLEESSFVQNNIVEEENLKDTKLPKGRPVASNDEVPTIDPKLKQKPIVVLEKLSNSNVRVKNIKRWRRSRPYTKNLHLNYT